MIEIGVDIGGTFTDLAVYDPAADEMRFGKVLTTPTDPSAGVRDALEAFDANVAEAAAFVHGTTLAIQDRECAPARRLARAHGDRRRWWLGRPARACPTPGSG